MLTMPEAEALKAAIKSSIEDSTSRQIAKAMLLDNLNKLSTKQRQSDKDRFVIGFSAVCLIKHRLVVDEKDAKRKAEIAQRIFAYLTEKNQRFRKFERMINLELGNYFFYHQQFDVAIELYETGLEKEWDKQRKNLFRLNIARANLAKGDFYHVLRIAEEMKLQQGDNPKLIEYGLLLQIRTFLVLGFDQTAVKKIKRFRDFPPTNAKTKLEVKYLGLMARFRFNDLTGFLKRWEEFLTFARKRGLESFYELELMLWRALINYNKVRNWRAFLQRAKYLSDQAHGEVIYRCLVEMRRALHKQDNKKLLIKAWKGLAPENHRLYQCSSLLLAHKFRQEKLLDFFESLIGELDYYFTNLHGGLPPSFLAPYYTDDSDGLGEKAKLASVRQTKSNLGVFENDWLQV